MLSYLLLFTAAAAVSYILAFPIRALALRLDVVDRPEKRKMHPIPIPLLGGAAIFLAFCLVSMAGVYFMGGLEPSAVQVYGRLLAGACIIVALGIYDDMRGITAAGKFMGQVAAALTVVALGARIELFTNPLGESFELGWLGIPLAVLWIVAVTNAVNLIDGLDGLAVGIGSIAALGLFAISFPENALSALLMIVLAGAGIGLLPHNFYPARVFLGDTGAMFIGFTLAVVALHGSLKATTVTVLFVPIIVLGVPLFDTIFAIFRRARRRVNPFKADREHIHHRLVRVGLHHRTVVLVLYFVCSYLAVTAYGIAHIPYRTALLVMVFLVLGGIIALRTLEFLEESLEKRLAAAERQQEAAVSRREPDARQATVAARAARRAQAFESMVCEASGFRTDFGDQREIDRLGSDIRTMLSRRVRVHGVMVEPTSPGRALVLIKTDPLKPSFQALVRDGLAWYLDEQRAGLGADADFPVLRWFEQDPVPGDERTEPSFPDRPASVKAREGDVVFPRIKERTGTANS